MGIFTMRTHKKVTPGRGRISTLTQIGSRLSLAKLHIRKLLATFMKDEASNHLFYLVDPANTALSKYLSEIAENKKVSVYTKNDNNVTDFDRLKSVAPFGGDANYEFLISRPEVGEYFLTLHDDSILLDDTIPTMLRTYGVYYDYIGYLDSRKKLETNYKNLLIDGLPLSSLRLGTWFTFGKTSLSLRVWVQNGPLSECKRSRSS